MSAKTIPPLPTLDALRAQAMLAISNISTALDFAGQALEFPPGSPGRDNEIACARNACGDACTEITHLLMDLRRLRAR